MHIDDLTPDSFFRDWVRSDAMDPIERADVLRRWREDVVRVGGLVLSTREAHGVAEMEIRLSVRAALRLGYGRVREERLVIALLRCYKMNRAEVEARVRSWTRREIGAEGGR